MKLYCEIHNWRGWYDLNGKYNQEVIVDVSTLLPSLSSVYTGVHLCIVDVDIPFPLNKISMERIPFTIKLSDGLFGETDIPDMMKAYWVSHPNDNYATPRELMAILNQGQLIELQRIVNLSVSNYISSCPEIEDPNIIELENERQQLIRKIIEKIPPFTLEELKLIENFVNSLGGI